MTNRGPVDLRYQKPKHDREKVFAATFFNHSNWAYEPSTFHVNGEKYTPDFYDGKRDVFIEVTGTRQAYHQNKHKYDLFVKLYSNLNFEIRTPDGAILSDRSGRINNLAEKCGCSAPMISQIRNGKARPSWKLAKRLAEVTDTNPELWLDGTPEEIKTVLNYSK